MQRIRRLLTHRRRRVLALEPVAVEQLDMVGFEAARAALGRAAMRNAGTPIHL